MWRVWALSASASLALLAGLAGGAGAGRLIDKPTLSSASGSAANALADEQLAKFTLMDSGTAAGRAEGVAAIKRSQAALSDALSTLGTGKDTEDLRADLSDALSDDDEALGAIESGNLSRARARLARANDAKQQAIVNMQADLLFGSPSVGEYVIPVLDSGPTSIVDWGGHLWFTLSNKGQLGEYNIFVKGVRETQTAGAAAPGFTTVKLPSHSRPQTLAEGPDGALWFTDTWQNAIGRLSPNGKLKEFKLAPASQPYGITVGPDGALWFTELGLNKVGRITTTGR